jgi:membrane protein required for colicin V production
LSCQAVEKFGEKLPFPQDKKIVILPLVNVFDLIVLAILAALTLRGIWKGMISQIVSVVSYFVCWIVATRFGGLVAPTIPVEAPWNQVLAMAVVFLITLIAIRFGAATLEKLIKDWHLQQLNTLLGGALGFAKGLLLCMIITFFAVTFSETSRSVVFNSVSGFRLAQLITQVGVFVPKDSYEFVHSQLAQFQNKVDETVPGQTPDPLPIQSSETMQQMVAQLQQSKASTDTNAGSLWTALSKWWNGTKEEKTTADSPGVALPLGSGSPLENSEPSRSLATAYTPQPPAPAIPQVNTYTEIPQPVATQPAVASTDLFIKRSEPSPPLETTPLAALLPATSKVPEPPTAALTSLATLTPLAEALAILPEPSQLLPLLPVSDHVGSDQLLRNSVLPATNPHTSARVYRPK